MKKISIYMLMLVGLVGFSACGGVESDAKAIAEKSCECDKLTKDESKAKEAEECMKSLVKLGEDTMKKYEDKKDDKDTEKKFKDAYETAYKACSK